MVRVKVSVLFVLQVLQVLATTSKPAFPRGPLPSEISALPLLPSVYYEREFRKRQELVPTSHSPVPPSQSPFKRQALVPSTLYNPPLPSSPSDSDRQEHVPSPSSPPPLPSSPSQQHHDAHIKPSLSMPSSPPPPYSQAIESSHSNPENPFQRLHDLTIEREAIIKEMKDTVDKMRGTTAGLHRDLYNGQRLGEATERVNSNLRTELASSHDSNPNQVNPITPPQTDRQHLNREDLNAFRNDLAQKSEKMHQHLKRLEDERDYRSLGIPIPPPQTQHSSQADILFEIQNNLDRMEGQIYQHQKNPIRSTGISRIQKFFKRT